MEEKPPHEEDRDGPKRHATEANDIAAVALVMSDESATQHHDADSQAPSNHQACGARSAAQQPAGLPSSTSSVRRKPSTSHRHAVKEKERHASQLYETLLLPTHHSSYEGALRLLGGINAGYRPPRQSSSSVMMTMSQQPQPSAIAAGEQAHRSSSLSPPPLPSSSTSSNVAPMASATVAAAEHPVMAVTRESQRRRFLRERFPFHFQQSHPSAQPQQGGQPSASLSGSGAKGSRQSLPSILSKLLLSADDTSANPTSVHVTQNTTASRCMNPNQDHHQESRHHPTQQEQQQQTRRKASSVSRALLLPPIGTACTTSSSHNAPLPVVKSLRFPSLQALKDAFRVKWSRLFTDESQKREVMAAAAQSELEQVLQDASRTMNVEAFVRPEIALALGLSVVVQLPNYLEEEAAAWKKAVQRITDSEIRTRETLHNTMIRDIAALRRSCTRQLRQLQSSLDAAAAAATLEAAQQLERRTQARLRAIALDIVELFEAERTKRLADIITVEFSERQTLEFRIRATRQTIVREALFKHFSETVRDHWAICQDEKNGRDAIEAEERSFLADWRQLAGDVERHHAVYVIVQRRLRWEQSEATLRPVKEVILLRQLQLACHESYTAYQISSYASLLKHAWNHQSTDRSDDAVERMPVVSGVDVVEGGWVFRWSSWSLAFLVFSEEMERRTVNQQRLQFVDQMLLFQSQAADAEAVGDDIGRSTRQPDAWWLRALQLSRLSDTPISDVALDSKSPRGSRSLMGSRQLSARRPLLLSASGRSTPVTARNVDACGSSAPTSRVQTADGHHHRLESSPHSVSLLQPATASVCQPPPSVAVQMRPTSRQRTPASQRSTPTPTGGGSRREAKRPPAVPLDL